MEGTMTNYIDTEKLKAEIERRKELLTPHKGQGLILCQEIIKQFDSLLSFIDTISQPIMKDDNIDKIRAEIERRFSEYNHDSNHHIQAAECASILDFIDSLQQEQTEVDLEKFDKDVTNIWGRCAAEPNDSIACFHIETFIEVARHFYELGRKGNKELNKKPKNSNDSDMGSPWRNHIIEEL